MQWNKTYGVSGQDVANSLIQTSDGCLAFAGSTPVYPSLTAPESFTNMWLVKTDTYGNLQWNQTFGSLSYGNPDTDTANCLVETSDGGFVLAGSINPGSTAHGGFYYVVKTTAVLSPPTTQNTPSPTQSPSFVSSNSLLIITGVLVAVIVVAAVVIIIKRPKKGE